MITPKDYANIQWLLGSVEGATFTAKEGEYVSDAIQALESILKKYAPKEHTE